MASNDHGRSWYRDDEIIVDKDGVPHYTGAMLELMREYRRRVLFAYNNLEGEGDDETKEAGDLEKKQRRFAKKLVDALHGEAWRSCEDLLTEPGLKEKDGYKLVFQALQAIEKVGVIKKTEAFDKFFERCHRLKGQSIDSFLRKRKQDWANLQDVAEGIKMSDDLMAYFLLKHANLSREDRRQILLANQSAYTVEGFEKALRVSYFDHHERERRTASDWGQQHRRPKGRGRGNRSYAVADEEVSEDEEAFENEEAFDEAYAVEDEEAPVNEADQEPPSDYGASGDDEIYEAFAAMDQQRKTYQESRQKLKQIQRNRGYFKGDISGQIKGEISYEERQKAIQKEKSRTRCAACDRLGHWAGDAICPKSSSNGPKRIQKGKGNKKGQGRGGRTGRAYLVGETPLYFSISEDEGLSEDGHCNMVGDGSDSDMQQDSGHTDTDDRRKMRPAYEPSMTDWEAISDTSQGYVSQAYPMVPWIPDASDSTVSGKEVIAEVTSVRKVRAQDVTELQIPCLSEVVPENLSKMKVRELQTECENWGIQCSGAKGELLDRLNKLFKGEMVLKKGCPAKFVRLVESPLIPAAESPLVLPKAKSRPPKVVQSEPKHGSTPPSKSVAEDDTFRRLTDERLFRRNLDSRLAAASMGPDETPRKDPRSGLAVPSSLEVGRVTALVRCPLCTADMVLRRNCADNGLFFGCSQFTAGKCRGTRKFDEMVEDGAARSSAASGSSQ